MNDERQTTPAGGGQTESEWLRGLTAKLAQDLPQLSDEEVPKQGNPCDEKVRGEEQSFEIGKQQVEIDKQQVEIDTLQVQLESLKQDIKLRRKFAWAGYWMNIGWLAAILSIILFAGFHIVRFFLPDSVLLALIGTTTANVLGVLYIVMRYLFDTKGRH